MRRISHKHLQKIKTLSDRVSDVERPQRKFIKLAILELEKVRRGKEKHSASQHVKDLDKRLAEIQIEQSKLMEAVYVVHQGDCRTNMNAPHAKQFISEDKPNNSDFNITY
jgi:hypothetical protein